MQALAPAGDLLFLPQEKKAKELGTLPSSWRTVVVDTIAIRENTRWLDRLCSPATVRQDDSRVPHP